MAQQLAKTKLQNILLDKQKTDRQKIDEIQKEFLLPKQDEEITEANAYRLIWTPPLSWDIHSIAIAYDVDRSRTHVISGETVDSRKKTRTEASENGTKSAVGSSVSGGMKTGLGYQTKVSMLGFLTARPQFEVEARGSHKTDWDESKTELWSKSRQEQLANSFEELTKDIQSTQVSKCHLTFAIDFRNGCDEDLMFSASSTVPVYMGRTLVLDARPENIGNNQTFTIPSRATVTIKFRGEISTTQAYRLLEFMKKNAPTIQPEKGQFVIKSLNGKVKNAIQESRSVSHSVIRCGEYEWKVRNTWNNRRVTLREALWAVNSLYEKEPFGIEDDVCVTMFGKFRCGPYPEMVESDAYPIAEIDGHFYSRLEKKLLDNKLQDKNVRFYIGTLEEYLMSDDYTLEFYSHLINELQSVAEQDKSGKVKCVLGWMYFVGKGTTENISEALKWYYKAAEQDDARAAFFLGLCYESGLGVDKNMTNAIEWYRKAAELGEAEAQLRVGVCYEYGLGVVKNEEKAVEWVLKAAEQGHNMAQLKLGVCYEYGIGVKKDISKAFEWWHKAAEQGFVLAQENLGAHYRDGDLGVKDMTKAVEWYRKAAEKGSAEAQYALGECYQKGEGIEKDLTKAVRWFHKAAEQGHAEAMLQLVGYYALQEDVENKAKAIQWLHKAAEHGNAEAQCFLGMAYGNGEGVQKNLTKAVELFSKSAEQGFAEAQCNLGWCYEKGDGVEKDMSEAVKWYRNAAEQGHPRAQVNLGMCYEHGNGVEMDISKAVAWYRKAAEQEDARAQFILGWCYKDGNGIQKNNAEAVKWWHKAAEHGMSTAQWRLGWCYENGEGITKDMTEAIKWYFRAAEQGYAEAQLALGECYYYGKGVRQNIYQAVEWYRKAAEQGKAYAQYNLGWCYEKGEGVEKDSIEAVKWYRKAADQGYNAAVEQLQELNQ